MSLSATLFRLARRLAPDHRKPWIDAMETEGAQTHNHASWAAGAVVTAINERFIHLTITGALTRAIGGAFVMGTGLSSLPFLARMLTILHDRQGYDRHPENTMVSLAIVCAIIVGLMATGAAIMIAGRNRIARIAARCVVIIMGTGLGLLLTWTGWISLKPHHHTTVFQHEMMSLSLLAGPALLVAATALLLKRPRLFLAAATTALGAEAGQWLIELSRHNLGALPALLGFYGACLPALLLLSAAGVITGRGSSPKRQNPSAG